MRVFVAGSTGVIGRVLAPQLVEHGHEVVALVRSPQKSKVVEAFGAKAAVADALDKEALTETIIKAAPEVIIHQLTALVSAGNLKKFDEEFALTNRLRIEVTDTMLAAARMVGTRRFIVQSFCGWPFACEGGPIKTEDDPLLSNPPANFGQTLAAIRYLEETIRQTTDLEVLALRYSILYGPGTSIAPDGSLVEMIRKRRMPIVGGGTGIWSFTHIHDAACATIAAMSRGGPGIYNVVDDEPAPVSTWLPALADAVGAKPPYKVPAWLGKLMLGEGGLSIMTQIRGASNAKAKRELGWQPIYPSWRRGFVEGLG
jgi:nucleoside-diphosphate-sugar epimerase